MNFKETFVFMSGYYTIERTNPKKLEDSRNLLLGEEQCEDLETARGGT